MSKINDDLEDGLKGLAFIFFIGVPLITGIICTVTPYKWAQFFGAIFILWAIVMFFVLIYGLTKKE